MKLFKAVSSSHNKVNFEEPAETAYHELGDRKLGRQPWEFLNVCRFANGPRSCSVVFSIGPRLCSALDAPDASNDILDENENANSNTLNDPSDDNSVCPKSNDLRKVKSAGSRLHCIPTRVQQTDRTVIMGQLSPPYDKLPSEPRNAVTARFKLYNSNADLHAHIDLELLVQWIEPDKGDDQYRSQADSLVTLRLTPSNIERFSMQQLPSQDATPPLLDIGEKVPDRSDLYRLDIAVRPDHPLGCNILADNADFGVWSDEIAAIRAHFVHGGHLTLITRGWHSFAKDVASILEAWAKEHTRDPVQKFWDEDDSGHVTSSSATLKHFDIPPEFNVAYPSRISFDDNFDFLTREMLGLDLERAYNKLYDLSEAHGCLAHFMRVPGEDDEEALFMFVNMGSVLEARLEVGNRILVRIHLLNPDDQEAVYWEGDVHDRYPGVNSQVKACIIRPRSDPRGQLDRLEPLHRDIRLLEPILDLAQAEEGRYGLQSALKKTKEREVDIYIEEDIVAYQRNVETLRHIHALMIAEAKHDPMGKSITEAMILGNRFDCVPITNALEDWTSEEVQMLKHDLGPRQEQLIDLLQHLVGGCLNILGCAGAGKTYSLKRLIVRLIQKQRREHQNSPARPGVRFLILSPINANCDDICQSTRRMCEELRLDDAIILRGFSVHTTVQLFTRRIAALKERGNRRATKSTLNTADIDFNDAAEDAYAFLHQFRSRRSQAFTKDRRVTKATVAHTAAEYLAYLIGIAKAPEDVSEAAITRLSSWVPASTQENVKNAYAACDVERPTPEDLDQLQAALQPGLACVKNAADAYVTTLSQGQAQDNVYSLRPESLAIDEAGLANAVDSLAAFRYPTAKVKLWVGDMYQTRPRVNSPAAFNNFALQHGTSFLVRSRACGLPAMEVFEEYRYPQAIANLLTDVFYLQQIQAHPSVQHRDSVKRAIQTFTNKFGVASPVVLLDVACSREERLKTGSRYNHKTLAMSWQTVRDLETSYGYRQEDFGIVTPYTAQRNLHENIARGAAPKKQTGTYGYMVESFDRAQGRQAPIAIVDIPNTQGVGFLENAQRIITGLSRCQDGLIIVADVANLSTSRIGRRGSRKLAIMEVIDWCIQNGCRVTSMPGEGKHWTEDLL